MCPSEQVFTALQTQSRLRSAGYRQPLSAAAAVAAASSAAVDAASALLSLRVAAEIAAAASC